MDQWLGKDCSFRILSSTQVLNLSWFRMLSLHALAVVLEYYNHIGNLKLQRGNDWDTPPDFKFTRDNSGRNNLCCPIIESIDVGQAISNLLFHSNSRLHLLILHVLILQVNFSSSFKISIQYCTWSVKLWCTSTWELARFRILNLGAWMLMR